MNADCDKVYNNNKVLKFERLKVYNENKVFKFEVYSDNKVFKFGPAGASVQKVMVLTCQETWNRPGNLILIFR